MSLRFQKRVSILPGVRLNFSLSGVSTTIGIPGASVTLGGPGGPTANLGIPGSGLSLRVPLAERPISPGPPISSQPEPPPSDIPNPFRPKASALTAHPMQAVQSGAVDGLTTPGLAALRDLISKARHERASAEEALAQAERAVREAEGELARARQSRSRAQLALADHKKSWLNGLWGDSAATKETAIRRAKAHEDGVEKRLMDARTKKAQATERLDQLWLDTEFQLSGQAETAWAKTVQAFSVLSRSQRIWDVTATRSKQIGTERSVVTQVVERTPTRLSVGDLPLIQSRYTPLRWHNANGGDLLVYPGFVVVFQSDNRFALLDLAEVNLSFQSLHFQEEETPPTDAKHIGTAYTYSNKDGSPDKRFAQNPELPVLLYAEIRWESGTGLSEAFQFSNAQAAAVFTDALDDFRRALKQG